jgi:hypothetical protein
VEGIILTTCSLADATIDSINSSFIIADDDVIDPLSCNGDDGTSGEVCCGLDD